VNIPRWFYHKCGAIISTGPTGELPPFLFDHAGRPITRFRFHGKAPKDIRRRWSSGPLRKVKMKVRDVKTLLKREVPLGVQPELQGLREDDEIEVVRGYSGLIYEENGEYYLWRGVEGNPPPLKLCKTHLRQIFGVDPPLEGKVLKHQLFEGGIKPLIAIRRKLPDGGLELRCPECGEPIYHWHPTREGWHSCPWCHSKITTLADGRKVPCPICGKTEP